MLLLPDRRNRVCLYGPGENDPHRHRAGRRDPLAVCLEIQQVLPVLQMRPDAAAGMEFLSRLDEGVVRPAQPAADAGDRTERVTEPIVPEALEALTQQEPAVVQVSALPDGVQQEKPAE